MVTSMFAAVLTLLFVVMTFRVIKGRRKNKISLGYGPNNEIIELVSAHSNFSNYTFLFLILMHLAESSGFISIYIFLIIGIIFMYARVIHFEAMISEKMNFKSRVRGMQLTIISLIVLAVLNFYTFLKYALNYSQFL